MVRSKEEVYIYRCAHIDVARYICIYSYVYMCVDVYIYRERESERERYRYRYISHGFRR